MINSNSEAKHVNNHSRRPRPRPLSGREGRMSDDRLSTLNAMVDRKLAAIAVRKSEDARRRGQPLTNTQSLAVVIAEFERRLPGWWWSVASCSVTRDASCGPDRNGPDADLLKLREFDEGFHHDGEGDVAASLRVVMEWAAERRAAVLATGEVRA